MARRKHGARRRYKKHSRKRRQTGGSIISSLPNLPNLPWSRKRKIPFTWIP